MHQHSHHRHHSHHSHGHHKHGAHQHGHGSHQPGDNPIAWAFFLNLGFTVIELVGGVLTNSTAIMADAVHDLGDTLAIGFAWWLQGYSVRQADTKFTYGYRRFSLLGALISGALLIAASGWVLSESIPRLADPVMPHTEGMLLLAIVGIAVNGYAAYRLSRGKSLNERALNWHLLEDVLGWVAVLIVAATLQFFDWPILDPALSIIFTVFIAFNVTRLLVETARVFFQAVPDEIVHRQIVTVLQALREVKDVHKLHFWSLDGEAHVLTVHLLVDRELDAAQQKDLKARVAASLAEYNLVHTTVELEFPGEGCRDELSGAVNHR